MFYRKHCSYHLLLSHAFGTLYRFGSVLHSFERQLISMDLLRETAPFLVGMIVPPILMLLIRPKWSGQSKFLATFLPALILSFCTSAQASELTAGMPDGLIARS